MSASSQHCQSGGSAVDDDTPADRHPSAVAAVAVRTVDGSGGVLQCEPSSPLPHPCSLALDAFSVTDSCISVAVSCSPAPLQETSADSVASSTYSHTEHTTTPQQSAPSGADIVSSAVDIATTGTSSFSSVSSSSSSPSPSSSPSSACASSSSSPSHTPSAALRLCPCLVSRRRAALLVCVVLVCLLLVGVGVSVGVLYPQPPSVSAHSLRLVRLTVDLAPSAASAAADGSSPPVNVSALLSVTFTLHNPNAYSAHHYASTVVIASLPPSAAPLSGQLVVPGGFIPARGSEELVTSVHVSTAITAPEQVVQWEAAGMAVEGRAETRGYVDFLFGLRVPFTVHTQCTATLTLRMQQSAVDVSQQQCSNGL